MGVLKLVCFYNPVSGGVCMRASPPISGGDWNVTRYSLTPDALLSPWERLPWLCRHMAVSALLLGVMASVRGPSHQASVCFQETKIRWEGGGLERRVGVRVQEGGSKG